MKRKVLLLFLLSAAVVFSFGVDPEPGQSRALYEINIANWIMGIGVLVWGVVQGLTVAWFKQRLSGLQTKDGCMVAREKCHVDDLKPLMAGDSERKNKLDVMANEVRHLAEASGRLGESVVKQGDEIAKLTKILIKIGARFGVDVNGKD